jgi:hypothetical protein
MTRSDGLALFLSLLAVAAALFVARGVFEEMAHLEDEFAYLWQAQILTEGRLSLPSPEHPKSFLVPFVVDYRGLRFGKYPLGWPVLLSFGVGLGLRSLVNPLLAGLAVWLTYRLGSRIFNPPVGVLAAALTVSSPFFLINGGSLLSHMWSLVLSLAFLLGWLDGVAAREKNSRLAAWLPAGLAGFSLGALALTRPLTAAAVALPAAVHGLGLLFRGSSGQRTRLLAVGFLSLGIGLLHFVWQFALTGEFTRNPYTLWWAYDRLGFGPGFGVTEAGHTLQQAWWNTKHSLRAGWSDLFGWGKISWLFLPFGLWAGRRKGPVYLLLGVPLALVTAYGAYWVGSWLLGPRYYFEALPALTILSAAGVFWLGGWSVSREGQFTPPEGLERVRSFLTAGLLVGLMTLNVRYYLPARLGGLRGLYTIERQDLEPFQNAGVQELTPALIIVHADPWMSYGSLLELTDPTEETPFLFAWSLSPTQDARLAAAYRDRRGVYHYYPDQEPWVLYTAPVPELEQAR